MSFALEITRIHKFFGSTPALNGVDLQIPKGQLFGLVGLNGAGKTTLIRILLGMIRPDQGSVKILGQPIRHTRGPWDRVGYLLADGQGYPRLTVLENLKVQARWRGGVTDQHLDDVLEQVQLSHARHCLAAELSTGNMQRLGLAAALLNKPELLILDEPINGLDPQGVLDIRHLFLRLTREFGTTILLSSHILDELSRIADAIGVIHSGQMVEVFSRQNLDDLLSPSLRLQIPDWKAALDYLLESGYPATHMMENWISVKDPRLAEDPRTLITALSQRDLTPMRVTSEPMDMTRLILDLITPAGT